MHIIIYGPEGSGKGTQAKLLSQKLQVPHLVSGDLVRETAKKDRGFLGKVCREALFEGHYVPDSEMFVLWKKRLGKPDAQKGWILDGFPRNLAQAEFLERKLKKYGKKLDVVFYLAISKEESIKRLLKRKRRLGKDQLHDSPERIKTRLQEYRKAEKKLLDFYKKFGVLQVVDGERTIEAIHKDIMERMMKLRRKEVGIRTGLSLRGVLTTKQS